MHQREARLTLKISGEVAQIESPTSNSTNWYNGHTKIYVAFYLFHLHLFLIKSLVTRYSFANLKCVGRVGICYYVALS